MLTETDICLSFKCNNCSQLNMVDYKSLVEADKSDQPSVLCVECGHSNKLDIHSRFPHLKLSEFYKNS